MWYKIDPFVGCLVTEKEAENLLGRLLNFCHCRELSIQNYIPEKITDENDKVLYESYHEIYEV